MASRRLRLTYDALMERIQRLATRTAKGMRELPYEGRLRPLNIFSLAHRRLRGDLVLAYNIFHGHHDFRRHDFKLRHRSFRLL